MLVCSAHPSIVEFDVAILYPQAIRNGTQTLHELIFTPPQIFIINREL